MNILLIIGSALFFRALYVITQRWMEELQDDLEAAKSFANDSRNMVIHDSYNTRLVAAPCDRQTHGTDLHRPLDSGVYRRFGPEKKV